MKPFPDAKVLVGTFERLNVHAAIYGQDGEEWATSADFKLSTDEVARIVAAFGAANATPSVALAGRTCTIVNRDDVSFSGTDSSEAEMFAVRKTQSAIVVTAWKGEGGPTLVRGAEKVDNAADYMMNEGY